MSKTANMTNRPSLPVPALDEVPCISDSERAKLQTSLGKASADIASGNFDVLTPQSLRTEFDGIYFGKQQSKSLSVR
jgi:hypothetical protein